MRTKDLSRLAVDGVICISLRERQDRRDLITDEFKNSGVTIEFMLVDPDTSNPERGCFDSHMQCARLAIERGYRNMLVLEDDATLLAFSPSKVDQINNFLAHGKPALFYFGATLGKIWLTWNRGVARFRAKGTFAYVLSNEGCKKLLGFSPYSGRAIDKIFTKHFKAYGVFPMICQHQPEELAKSDILLHRSKDGTSPDAQFWESNRRRQYSQAFKNLGKTLLLRDL